MSEPETSTAPREDSDAPPCVQGLIAGTVALMTTWADPCPGCPLSRDERRVPLARRIVANLFFLARHPALGPEMRQVFGVAHQRWARVAQRAAGAAAAVAESRTATAGLH